MANIEVTISCGCDHCGKRINITKGFPSHQLLPGDHRSGDIAKECFKYGDNPIFGHPGPNRSILCAECYDEYRVRINQYKDLMKAYSDEYVHVVHVEGKLNDLSNKED